MEKKLDKIVFINSANIRYAEIFLDGNIHFTGNQGAGKTTILRAIQYFFTADRTKLGISTDGGRKSFEDFYFPNNYAHIVYEVQGEQGLYSVILCRVQGRIHYHFIDAPYDKNWFFDDGVALGEWMDIKHRLPNEPSPAVTTLENFRNIIYGNKTKADKVFHKYAIMWSRNYMQLIQTLQNVFLNSSLDSAQIKATIVESILNGQSGLISFEDYREDLRKFDNEFSDVSLWYKKQGDEHIEVRELAESVSLHYGDLQKNELRLSTACRELAFSKRTAEQQLPVAEADIAKHTADIKEVTKRINNLENEFKQKVSEIDQQIGGLSSDLQRCKSKKDIYQSFEFPIEELIRRCAQLSYITDTLRGKMELLKQYNTPFKNIEEKYALLIKEEQDLFKSDAKQIKESYDEEKDKLLARLQSLYESRTEKPDADGLRRAVLSLVKQIDEAISELQHRYSVLINHTKNSPYALDLINLSQRLQEQILEQKDNQTNLRLCEMELKYLLEKQQESDRSRVKELNQKIRELRFSVESAPVQIDSTKTELQSVQKKAEQESEMVIAEDIEQVEEQLQYVLDLLSSIEKEFDKQDSLTQKNNLQFEKDKAEIDSALEKAKQTKNAKLKEIEDSLTQRLAEIETVRLQEIAGSGGDTKRIEELHSECESLSAEKQFVEKYIGLVADYERDKKDFFDNERIWKLEYDRLQEEKKKLEEQKKASFSDLNQQRQSLEKSLDASFQRYNGYKADIEQFNQFVQTTIWERFYSKEDGELPTADSSVQIIQYIRSLYQDFSSEKERLAGEARSLSGKFSENNVFHFSTHINTDQDVYEFAENIVQFIQNNTLDTFSEEISKLYMRIVIGLSHEINQWKTYRADIERLVSELNENFAAKRFAGVIKEIRLRVEDTDNKLVSLLYRINDYAKDNAAELEGTNLFSQNTRRSQKVVLQVIQHLQDFDRILHEEHGYKSLSIADTFDIQFKVQENQNDTNWTSRLRNVGSDGTDILVKSIIYIMLVSIFKLRAAKNAEETWLHCMIDETGRLHTSNIAGLIKFANDRKIYIVNGSPSSTEPEQYRHTYVAVKDEESITTLHKFIGRRIA